MHSWLDLSGAKWSPSEDLGFYNNNDDNKNNNEGNNNKTKE